MKGMPYASEIRDEVEAQKFGTYSRTGSPAYQAAAKAKALLIASTTVRKRAQKRAEKAGRDGR